MPSRPGLGLYGCLVPSLSSCPSGKMAAEKPDLCHPQVTSPRHLFFVGRHAPLGSGTVGRLQAVAVVRFAQEGPYVVGSRREVVGCVRGRVVDASEDAGQSGASRRRPNEATGPIMLSLPLPAPSLQISPE